MRVLVFDTESDGLAYEATKIHVMSYTWDGHNYKSTSDYFVMRSVLKQADLLVCHNAVRHDLPLLNRILNIDTNYKQYADTLALSWYLNFNRPKHDLESYGPDYGLSKPKISDWHNLSYLEYANRCEEDTKINFKLWVDLRGKLISLYGDNKWSRLVEYLSFKMDCAREQEETKWAFNEGLAEQHFNTISKATVEIERKLRQVMPLVAVFKSAERPKMLYKKSGDLTVYGKKWFDLLRSMDLPMTHSDPVKYSSGFIEGNPASTPQVKAWLFRLGWKPEVFKFVKEGAGGERKIPQVRYPKNHPEEGQLCKSVLELKDKDSSIALLEGYTVLKHRKAFFSRMLDSNDGGYLTASIDGFTNTLRFKHRRPLANIPGVDKPWGKEIRSCLTCEENTVLIGADMSSLESTTKRHYMMPYDPKYVKEMSRPGFDEHLDLAKHAGAITAEDVEAHKSGTKDLSAIRKIYKAANYSCIYGVGAPKFSREVGVPLKQAQNVIQSYWDRNWAVKRLSEEQYIKEVGDEVWLKNPVSGFYHNLRSDKDRFSTLNQSTGVFCFDNWTKEIREQGVRFCGQFHDEHIARVPIDKVEEITKIYQKSLDKINSVPMLRVPLGMECHIGKDYSEIH